VVVLGLNPDENLFISGEGRWNARYLPASIRSYPFAFTESSESGSLQILIDEAYPGFGGTEGLALFGATGEPAPELQGRLQFMEAHLKDIALTRRFGAELHRLGLLIERSAQLQVADDARFNLNGFWIVDEAKLNTLADADLLQLARQGDLSLITAHLLSISNLGLLAPKLKQSAEGGPSAAPRRSTTKGKARSHAKN
jgi:hypothetical protein